MKGLKKYKVAAVQAGPVYLDLDATVEKACGFIKEAAENGAKLVGFPEAYLPGYPWWIWLNDTISGAPLYQRLYENAVVVGGEAFQKISRCARENDIYVCISGSEKDGSSLYLTQFWFDDMGNLLGKHRKIKPTNAERTIWGDGNGNMEQVFDTKIGKLGGLQCGEHLVPLNTACLGGQGIQVHVASWPPLPIELEGPLGLRVNRAATQYNAISNQAFALFCTQVMNQDAIDVCCGGDEKLVMKLPTSAAGTGGTGGGASAVINPIGQIISEVIPPQEEGIVYGDIDLDMAVPGKMLFDPAGHYGRGDCLQIVLNHDSERPVVFIGEQADNSIGYEKIQGCIV